MEDVSSYEDVVEESLRPEWVERAALSYHTVEKFGEIVASGFFRSTRWNR